MAGAGTAALPEPRNIAQLLARFACNNHTICDEELRVIGMQMHSAAIGSFPHLLPSRSCDGTLCALDQGLAFSLKGRCSTTAARQTQCNPFLEAEA